MCHKKKLTLGFPTRSDTNQAVQLQKMARGLKFRIKEVDGLYYLCNGSKSADQLRSNRTADQRLCFLAYAKSRFSHLDKAMKMFLRSFSFFC